MRRLVLAALALFTLAALAGVVGLPQGARADQTPSADTATVTVGGVGSVSAVPDRARFSFGVETRATGAQAAISANGVAMRRLIAALREAGAENVQTQWVSVSQFYGDQGTPQGYVASNVVSATIAAGQAGALIDSAVEAGANQVSGPSLERTDATRLYRQALEDAVSDARARAETLARAAGRELGEITSMVESGSASPPGPMAEKAASDAGTPVVSGELEITAVVSVTFVLK